MIEWIGLSYKIQSDNSKHRVAAWRRLKELGGIYLHDGFALLPNNDDLKQQLDKLRQSILDLGSEASVMFIRFENEGEEEACLSLFNAARNEEYSEVMEQCERLVYELDRETEKGKFTFAEIEENEAFLEKLKKWMDNVKRRDYFHTPERQKAEDLLEKCEKRLTEYVNDVYRKNVTDSI